MVIRPHNIFNDSVIIADNFFDETQIAEGGKKCCETLALWNPRIMEAFTIYAGGGWKRARLLSIEDNLCIFKCFENIYDPEISSSIFLYQAVPEKERMELIIEKAVELGVFAIFPVVSEKSSSIEKRDSKQKKSHNWHKIAIKAAKQCRRAVIPQIFPEISLEKAIEDSKKNEMNFFLNEYERNKKIFDLLMDKKPCSISVFTGPEGGFSAREKEIFNKNGIISASIGSRILRTETASISAVSIISHYFESFS